MSFFLTVRINKWQFLNTKKNGPQMSSIRLARLASLAHQKISGMCDKDLRGRGVRLAVKLHRKLWDDFKEGEELSAALKLGNDASRSEEEKRRGKGKERGEMSGPWVIHGLPIRFVKGIGSNLKASADCLTRAALCLSISLCWAAVQG